MTGNLPKCYSCHFMLLRDYGYSDYTVEGTMVECLKQKFGDREKAYGANEKDVAEEVGYLDAAALNCRDYKAGEPLNLNVDCSHDEEIANHLNEVA